jgi:hypothetical protein
MLHHSCDCAHCAPSAPQPKGAVGWRAGLSAPLLPPIGGEGAVARRSLE